MVLQCLARLAVKLRPSNFWKPFWAMSYSAIHRKMSSILDVGNVKMDARVSKRYFYLVIPDFPVSCVLCNAMVYTSQITK